MVIQFYVRLHIAAHVLITCRKLNTLSEQTGDVIVPLLILVLVKTCMRMLLSVEASDVFTTKVGI